MNFRTQKWLLLFVAILSSCAGSIQYEMVQDRQQTYQNASREYHRAEEEYINLLFNLERLPKDPYLLEQKKIQMKELEHLRALLLQSRSELDVSVQQWESELIRQRITNGQPTPQVDPNTFKKSVPQSQTDTVVPHKPMVVPLPRVKPEQPPPFVAAPAPQVPIDSNSVPIDSNSAPINSKTIAPAQTP